MNLPVNAARTGAGMAIASILCVQLGLAVSVQLFDQVGPVGAAWLRLGWGGLILLSSSGRARGGSRGPRCWPASRSGSRRPASPHCSWPPWRGFPRTATRFGISRTTRDRRLRGRRGTRLWPLLAAAGVLLLTEPWHGGINPAGVAYALAAAVCWAVYILLTQRVGDEVSGLRGLAVSMPVAGIVATLVIVVAGLAGPAGTSVFGRLTWEVLAIGFGLAVLLPVIPYSLELLALRRLTTATFGTLMSLEPAVALIIGFVVLRQAPDPTAVAGVAFVIAASIGAERAGMRTERASDLDHGGGSVRSRRTALRQPTTPRRRAVRNRWRGARFGPRRTTRRLTSVRMTHMTIEPSILYFGTPIALLSTLNADGSANLAPMSSAWRWAGSSSWASAATARPSAISPSAPTW